jgi:pSer/pThr/pTyr-binding forkhead associated (FHA) protein
MALVDRFARTAWLRVRTGPLAGKAFVLYRTPTTVGSSPDAHIYLFKDAEIDALHAQIHRIGSSHEVEDMGSRHGTKVADREVRRRRLVSGDQIVVGNTILEFEERSKQSHAS